jgi:tetratricopeptide (TPR) repeat protein
MRVHLLLVSFILAFTIFNFTAAQTVSEMLKQADSTAASFDNQNALLILQKAEKSEPGNWEVLWRISRTYVDIAEHMPDKTGDQKDAQLAVYEKALNYANKAVALKSDQSITYLRRAIANGKIALFKGVFSVSGVVNQVKEDCENAIKLKTGGNYVQGLAHHVLGRTHSKISEKWAPARTVLGLGWANSDTGIGELKKACELYPDFRMFHFELAKALIKNDEYEQARFNLMKVIESPEIDEDDKMLLTEAKKLLNEIKNE